MLGIEKHVQTYVQNVCKNVCVHKSRTAQKLGEKHEDRGPYLRGEVAKGGIIALRWRPSLSGKGNMRSVIHMFNFL